MDRVILIGKEGERNFIFLPEKIHFKVTVSRANTDQFNFVFEFFIGLDGAIEFVHPERFFLTKRSVHVEDLDDNNFSPDLGNGESGGLFQTQVIPSSRIFGHFQGEWRQNSTSGWWFSGSQDWMSCH